MRNRQRKSKKGHRVKTTTMLIRDEDSTGTPQSLESNTDESLGSNVPHTIPHDEDQESTPEVKERARPIRIFVAILIGFFLRNFLPDFFDTDSPLKDLKVFVQSEKANNVALDDIEELQTEKFQAYARASCVDGSTAKEARENLFQTLRGVPDSVRTDIVEISVPNQGNSMNSFHDASFNFGEGGEGTADMFMAFWSTKTSKRDGLVQTCALVTGVTLKATDRIAGYDETSFKMQVGEEPCHCGLIWCEKCPVLKDKIIKTPIWKPGALTLKKQKDLRKWMVTEAIKSAEHLVYTGPSSYIGSDGAESIGGASADSWSKVNPLQEL